MAKTNNILVITYWSYKDALIQAYTLPYLKLFYDILPNNRFIYLVTLEQKYQLLSPNEKAQITERLRMQGIKWIPLRYHKFGIRGFFNWLLFMFRLLWISFTRNISHIHAWCTPAGSIGYLVSKITGKKLVIDSFEPHAEVMLETKTWSEDSLQYKILFNLEGRQCKQADTLICCTEDMSKYALEKFNCEIKQGFVKPACVDLEQFSLANRKNTYLLRKLKLEDKIVCVYAGKFGGLYLEQEVFDFFKAAYDKWQDKFRVLLLTNQNSAQLKRWTKNAGIPEGIILKQFVFHAEVPDYIGLGDFAISPYNPVPSRKHAAPIKNSEYWALGLPIVITNNIADDSLIVEEREIGAVIKEFNYPAYKTAVEKIDTLLRTHSMQELYNLIRPIAAEMRNFEVAHAVYRKIYA